MPITQSAKKAMRQSMKKRADNNKKKKDLKIVFKQMNTLLLEGKGKEAEALLPQYQKLLGKAAKVNVFHPNRAARKHSRMMKKIRNAS